LRPGIGLEALKYILQENADYQEGRAVVLMDENILERFGNDMVGRVLAISISASRRSKSKTDMLAVACSGVSRCDESTKHHLLEQFEDSRGLDGLFDGITANDHLMIMIMILTRKRYVPFSLHRWSTGQAN